MIDTTIIVSPGGRQTVNAGREQAYCIPRFVFDEMIWRHAVAAGCRPLRQSIRDISTEPTLGAYTHVIDARGAHAGTANAVALRAYWSVPRTLLGAGDDAAVQIHTDAEYRRGYGWLFPVGSDRTHVRFNLGVGLWKEDSKPGRDIADFYERFTATNTELRRWREAARIERPAGCHVGLGLRANAVATGDVLRIGDAANLADPLTGDGIGNALASGRHVAEVITAALDRSAAAAAWQARYHDVFESELRRALLLRQALVTTAGKNIAAGLLNAAPSVRRRVHSAFFGETSYRDMWRRGSRMAHL
jgi:flavin-dependent dehydrogenase